MERISPPPRASRTTRAARAPWGFVAALAALSTGPAGLSSPRLASADAFDEREQQLKALGIDDDLRPRIHRAIGIGSHALAGALAKGVKPPGASRALVPVGTGSSILATLALAHSRTPESTAAAKSWVQRLLVVDPLAIAEITNDTYMAGIVGQLAADPACEVPPSVSREIALRFAATQETHGWWGYSIAASAGVVSAARGGPLPADREGPANLSTTQFAVLGIFGLRRAGAPVPLEVWERHATGICELQAQDGSWEYGPTHATNGYANGTYMGLSSVLVCEDMLRDRARGAALLENLAKARMRALLALRREVRGFLRFAKTGTARAQKAGPARGLAAVVGVDGYGMYAMEKACIFAGVERVDEQSWYEAGARLLVAAQREDGLWGDLNTTSFALLFLSRAPDRLRPTTVTEPAPRVPPATTVTEK